MSDKSKADKLKELDTLVLDKMLQLIRDNKTEALNELTPAVQFLKANQVVEPPNRGESDPVEERKKKLAEVRRRRE